MKLSKKTEAEVLKTYHAYWNAYLEGNMRLFASMLDKDCHLIGSAAGEVFYNKKSAVTYYKATAEQIAGKAEFRNRNITVMPVERGVLVNEELDFYLLIDNQWTFYGHGRISSLFHKKNNKWKVIHQHGSLPDSKTEEGEQVSTEKIKAENVQLRDAVKRRTIQLEEKNRELEIEAALERVSTRSLAMQKSDELVEASDTMFDELNRLQVETIRVGIGIIDTVNDKAEIWSRFEKNKKIEDKVRGIVPAGVSVVFDNMLKSKKEKKSYTIVTLKGIEVKKHYQSLSEYLSYQPQKVYNKKESFHSFYFAEGSLNVVSREQLNEEECNIMLRFAKVFGQMYRRFLDLKKAEAQAREAQIEAALERVRARTMAMQHHDDLLGVITLLAEQLFQLGFEIDVANFSNGIPDKGADWDLWIYAFYAEPGKNTNRVIFPWIDHPYFQKTDLGIANSKKGIDLNVAIFNKEEKDSFLVYIFKNTIYGEMPEEVKTIVYEKPGFTFSGIFLKETWVTIGKYDTTPFSDEQHVILRRFAHAFGQAYTRFVDLQKAEAQARESQIQLALERVRARTMAMQRSHELNEVVHELYIQIRSLNFQYGACTIVIMNKNSEDMDHWLAGFEQEKYPERYPVKNIHHWLHVAQISAWKQGEKFATFEVDGDEIKVYADLMFSQTGYKNLPAEEKKRLRSQDFVVFNMAYMSFGALMWAPARLTDEQAKILQRFANVFDQTYTRFLDIQKAETQARDSQIELALERVRARTMAMQRSDELREAVLVIYEQLQQLNFESRACNIIIIDKESGSAQYWVSGFSQEIFPESYTVPYLNHPYQDALLKPWKQGDKYVVYEYTGRMKQSFDEIFFTKTEFRNVPEDAKKIMIGLESVMLSTAFISYGALQALGAEPLSEENASILQRFAKVFEQTYTRFLDLQKAEAQARESQIQLALERVRARTMAMQKSEELGETSFLLFEQFRKLGDTADQVTIGIINENEMTAEMSATVHGHQLLQTNVSLQEPIVMLKIFEAWKAKQPFVVIDVSGKLLREYNQNRNRLRGEKIFPENTGPDDHWIVHVAFFSKGLLSFSSTNLQPAETRQLLERFAGVFDLTYTRFLDLKNAESQARESTIQLALERVRARTMAMQKSDELRDAASLLFKQLEGLGVTSWSSGFNIWQDDGRSATINMCNPDGSIATPYHLPHTEDIFFINICEARQRQEDLLVMETGGKELEDTYNFMFSLPEVKKMLGGMVETGFQIPKFQVNHCAFFSHGYLMFITYQPVPEMWDVFKRFAKVFEQTYTRFLDLQKAEAQARESQIQLALERVRARAMAMQRSDELSEAASLLFQQVQSLGASQWTAGYCIFDEDKTAITLWMSGPWGDIQPSFRVPLDENPSFINYLEAHNKGLEMYIEENSAKVNEENYQYLLTLPVVGERLNSIIAKGLPLPTYQVDHCAYFSKGFLLFITYQQVPELHSVFKRFAAVFDQTYTRFLDLQKAEAQAREAKIEAALEKVRSRSLAMHKSDEIEGVLHALYERLKELDIDFYTAIIILFEKDSKDVVWWLESKANHPFLRSLIPYTDISYFRNLFEARQNGTELISNFYPFEEKNKLFHHLFDHTDLKYTPAEQKKFLLEAEFATMAVALAKNTAIHLTSYSRTSFSEQDHDVLKRFAKVFEQAYTRFLDLQKAEAQAREAQIEVALERTRTQSMIMQHSKELDDTLRVFHEQVLLLGINSAFSFLWLPDEEKDRHIFWAAWEEDLSPESSGSQEGLPDGQAGKNRSTVFKSKAINYPLDRNEPATAQCLVDWKSNEPVYSYHVPPGAVENYFAVWQELIDGVEHLKPEYFSGGLHYVEAFMKYGCFGVMVATDLTDDEKKILGRFAIEFERTYTRFLDLQRSEAQAREAQIQLAMERVRARTMAMQRSEELTDTAALLFQQINELGVPQLGNAFQLWDDDMKAVSVWACTKGVMSPVFKIPATEDPVMINIANAALKGEPLYVEAMEGDSLQNHYTYMLSIPAFKELYEVLADSGNTPPKFQIFHAAYFSYGYILFVTNEPYAEAHDIFIRFAKVFEQTYTRFLDLQKAEEQARESRIQLALERVRARTMAMQKSNELPDAALLLATQVEELGVELWSTSFQLWDKDRKAVTAWTALKDIMLKPFKIPATEEPLMIHIGDAAKKGELLYVEEMGEEPLVTHMHFMLSLPGVKEEFGKVANAGFAFPTFDIFHAAYFSMGFILFITEKPYPEAHDIFKRFAKVFEQTYTRFLDLQKAEAQAKEAQIEAALERVRSRSMGMQKSEELKEVIQVVYEQFVHLNIKIEHTGFVIDYKARDDYNIWIADPLGTPSQVTVPYFDSVYYNRFNEAKKNGEDFFATNLSFEEKNKFYQKLFEYVPGLPEEAKKFYFSCPALAVSTVLLENVCLYIENFSGTPYSDADNATLMRFGKVFQQTYTRFLDLQKAEDQARESQIEAALERVRSRSMGMQKSEELREVIQVIYEQLVQLNFEISNAGFLMDYRESEDGNIWMTDATTEFPTKQHVPWFDHPFNDDYLEHRDKGPELFTKVYPFEEKNTWWGGVLKYLPAVSEETRKVLFSLPALALSRVLMKNIGLYLLNFAGSPYSEQENATLIRFGKVFEQTYTRFNDLQKAEEQAREAKIEAALEKVRSRTMAMQRSAELSEVATVLFQQVKALGVHQWTCGFGIFEIDDKEFTWYQGSEDGSVLPPCQIPLTEHPVFISFNESRKRGDELYVYEKTGELQRDHYSYMCSLPVLGKLMQDRLDAGMQFPTFQIDHVASFSHGNLVFITYEPVPEMHDVFKRFAKVFDQTYTRFLDLQKSEAQAREAKIEAALERVRSRSMAMQRSEELAEVATVLFQQVKALGVPQWVCGFSIFEIDDKECTWYPGSADGEILPPNKIPLTEHPVFISYNESRKRGDELFVYEKGGEYQAGHYRYMQSLPGMGGLMQKLLDAGYTIPTFQIDHIANFSHGNLVFITYEHFPEMHDVFKRFAKVFDQTYTRFLDLQKAEAQAKESRIEAALERVRSRTMAMQHSVELGDAALLLFQQAQALGARSFACGFTIWGEEKKTGTFWMAQESVIQPPFIVNSTEDVFRDIYEAAERGESLYVKEQEGKELEAHYQYMSTNTVFKGIMEKMDQAGLSVPVFQILHCAFFSQGFLLFITYEPVPEIWDVFKRFAKVFDQTYTRFLDLQKAEAQAREAVKQASVDRVRAEIASMRTTKDLERITPLIWNELTTLGVPFIRCGVFIMDEEQRQVQSFLSTPDGKAIAAFRQPYNSPGEIAQVVEHWHKKKMYKQHWNEAQFIEFTKNLVQQGAVTSGEKYFTENRPTELYLHFVPFLQGMLYAGSTTELSDDELRLMQDLADAFSTAYARYEDFNKLETAKETVEQTLVDLKQAQQQLVQSEKMASLGELTAGIAHEIQNPLNFVNNFSEVNRELLSEMKAEIEKGNIGEVIAIADDIIGNEEKINHHGKRADAIVKGMLQHSRAGGGQKEPTDINALCDEYLRLAYHGLRAKDKSFNAKFETNLDKGIGKINIIPQDIGRVLVNLINNAFYAVNEKQKQNGNARPDDPVGRGYEPSVTVTSKKDDDGIELSVTDNGNGIPQKVLDKIFQPFFTTKPTGQGTGLGLSLAYDIIKTHNGEIKVESKEREGTTFTIRLPENS